jgi:Cu-Zn family superoxide dismutase
MDSSRLLVITSATTVMALAVPAAAQQATAEMHAVSAEGIGEEVGTVQLADSAEGLVIQTDLSGLPPGPHGLHLHSEGSCEPAQNDQGQMAAAMAAKGHYDPDSTGKHAGPEGEGHKGDLPVLEVAADGTAQVTLTATRLKLADAQGRALMIHAGGDNYSDEPKPLGGGGARIACGVIE